MPSPKKAPATPRRGPGRPRTPLCAACGKPIRPPFAFCPRCGTSKDASATPETPPATLAEVPAPPADSAAAARDLQDRQIRVLNEALSRIEAAMAKRKAHDPKLASQAGTLARSLAALTAEVRKRRRAEEGEAERMSPAEVEDEIVDFVLELAPARREALLERCRGTGGETRNP